MKLDFYKIFIVQLKHLLDRTSAKGARDTVEFVDRNRSIAINVK